MGLNSQLLIKICLYGDLSSLCNYPEACQELLHQDKRHSYCPYHSENVKHLNCSILRTRKYLSMTSHEEIEAFCEITCPEPHSLQVDSTMPCIFYWHLTSMLQPFLCFLLYQRGWKVKYDLSHSKDWESRCGLISASEMHVCIVWTLEGRRGCDSCSW